MMSSTALMEPFPQSIRMEDGRLQPYKEKKNSNLMSDIQNDHWRRGTELINMVLHLSWWQMRLGSSEVTSRAMVKREGTGSGNSSE